MGGLAAHIFPPQHRLAHVAVDVANGVDAGDEGAFLGGALRDVDPASYTRPETRGGMVSRRRRLQAGAGGWGAPHAQIVEQVGPPVVALEGLADYLVVGGEVSAAVAAAVDLAA